MLSVNERAELGFPDSAQLTPPDDQCSQVANVVLCSHLPERTTSRATYETCTASTLNKGVIHVAPAPIFASLKRLDNGMLRFVEVFGGMFVLG